MLDLHCCHYKFLVEINRAILEDLSERAIRDKTLTDSDIAEILKGVVVTDSFAMPFGRDIKFSTTPENKHGITIM